jgi:hypothetical protein
MEQAPAVWELDGPTMLGPRTSKMLINAMMISFFSQLKLKQRFFREIRAAV